MYRIGLVMLLMWALAPASSAVPMAVQESGQTAEPEEERLPLSIPSGYQYSPAGRRDPFVNPVPPPPPPVVIAGRIIPAVRPPGLPGVLMNEAQLIGLVISRDTTMRSVVVIRAPGARTFFAEVGDELLDAVIKRIGSDTVVFELKPLPGREDEEREEVERRLNSAPGE